MQGLTVAEIAERLGIHPKAAKTRLRRAAIKPIEYAGPTALYAPDVVEKIREVPGRGRPKKAKPE
jgi:predicted ArsR family transcriptional regulator